ncbi:MAG: hypothetical protein EON92_11955 [Burkholderiales bacterium]|nr:MAG: hypothetical protein EON92_11955 [Burkholderiales bacterium]
MTAHQPIAVGEAEAFAFSDTAQLVVTFKTEEETRKFVQDQPDIFGGRNPGIKCSYSYKTDKNDYRYILQNQ